MRCLHCAGTGDHFDHKLNDWAPHGTKCPHCNGCGECDCPGCDIYGVNRPREEAT